MIVMFPTMLIVKGKRVNFISFSLQNYKSKKSLCATIFKKTEGEMFVVLLMVKKRGTHEMRTRNDPTFLAPICELSGSSAA